jgi:hypothetical protein
MMRWITRERVKVDRVACPWLITKFVDPGAEFYFVPADQVLSEAERLEATPFDVKGVELGHHGQECSFEAILKKYNLSGNPALALLGKIVNGADTDNALWKQPEALACRPLKASATFADDHDQRRRVDRLRRAVRLLPGDGRQGKPDGAFKD